MTMKRTTSRCYVMRYSDGRISFVPLRGKRIKHGTMMHLSPALMIKFSYTQRTQLFGEACGTCSRVRPQETDDTKIQIMIREALGFRVLVVPLKVEASGIGFQ